MKIVFWNVDTQRDFMEKEGKLYIQGAEEIYDSLTRLTKLAKDCNITVVNTADYHNFDSKEFSIFPAHCIIATDGAEFIPATYPHQFSRESYTVVEYNKDAVIDEAFLKKSRNVIIHKDDFDVFKGNPLTEKVLDILKPDLIVVYGVATNVCVNFAVLGLLQRGYKVVVVKEAIKEISSIPFLDIITDWKVKGAILENIDVLEKNIPKLI